MFHMSNWVQKVIWTIMPLPKGLWRRALVFSFLLARIVSDFRRHGASGKSLLWYVETQLKLRARLSRHVRLGICAWVCAKGYNNYMIPYSTRTYTEAGDVQGHCLVETLLLWTISYRDAYTNNFKGIMGFIWMTINKVDFQNHSFS